MVGEWRDSRPRESREIAIVALATYHREDLFARFGDGIPIIRVNDFRTGVSEPSSTIRASLLA